MRLRIPILLLVTILPAGCSGTTPYSSTISATDASYARDTIIHASTAIGLLTDPARSIYLIDRHSNNGPMAAGDFARRAQADVRALRGVLESAGLEPPTWREIRRHDLAHPDPGVRPGRSPLAIAAAADQAIIQRALDYVDAGRSATIRSIARRAVDHRLTSFVGNQ